MRQINLESWEEFEDQLRELKQLRQQALEPGTGNVSNMLFRGQRDASWTLDTSLGRRFAQDITCSHYYHIASRAKPQIETNTDRQWELPHWPDLDSWWREYENLWKTPPGYDYLIYLRHHGFPSPLLDWTRSPYVAAQFAFSSAYFGRAAIFVYWEYTGHGKVGSSGVPLIRSLGPYVRSHSRHFLQQSEYTTAYQFREGEWWYASHESVFADAPEGQDRLWKFTLPETERLKVLRILDDHNLNAFSLFQTEEALLETISLREFEFRRADR